MRTVRPKGLADKYAYPQVQIARLVEQGAVVRLTHGHAIAVPDDQDRDWRPAIEEAATGIAADGIHLIDATPPATVGTNRVGPF